MWANTAIGIEYSYFNRIDLSAREYFLKYFTCAHTNIEKFQRSGIIINMHFAVINIKTPLKKLL